MYLHHPHYDYFSLNLYEWVIFHLESWAPSPAMPSVIFYVWCVFFFFPFLFIRLFDSAKALAFINVPTREEVRVWGWLSFYNDNLFNAFTASFCHVKFILLGLEQKIFAHFSFACSFHKVASLILVIIAGQRSHLHYSH